MLLCPVVFANAKTWMGSYIPHEIMAAISYSYHNHSQAMLVKGVPQFPVLKTFHEIPPAHFVPPLLIAFSQGDNYQIASNVDRALIRRERDVFCSH